MTNEQNAPAVLGPVERQVRHHEWDHEGCCIYCDFDGAEWHWWKHSTYEGRAQPEARQPQCKERTETPGKMWAQRG